MLHRAILSAAEVWAWCRHPVLIGSFRRQMGHFPRTALPRTYNEKVLWRKIFDRNPAFCDLSDKLKARKTFQQVCPDIALAELLWEGDRPEDIPDRILDGNVVVKTNHASGFNCFIHDGQFDREQLNANMRRWLGHVPYGRSTGEWGYFAVKPRLFVERMLVCDTFGEPLWISLHVFFGVTVLAWVGMSENHQPRRAALFDPAGRRHPEPSHGYSDADRRLPDDFVLPPAFHDAVGFAESLGRDLDYVRLDVLCCSNRIYGSEFTLYPLAGFLKYPSRISNDLAQTWDLSRSWFMTREHTGLRRIYTESLHASLRDRVCPDPG